MLDEYVAVSGLKVAKPLHDLIRDEIAPGTGVESHTLQTGSIMVLPIARRWWRRSRKWLPSWITRMRAIPDTGTWRLISMTARRFRRLWIWSLPGENNPTAIRNPYWLPADGNSKRKAVRSQDVARNKMAFCARPDFRRKTVFSPSKNSIIEGLRPCFALFMATGEKRWVWGFVSKLFGGELHAKRVLYLANATLGLLSRGTMRVHAIG
jgi:hypothetical protein